MPQWNTISISGYHIREAGSTAVQELAFTLADGFEYVRWAHRARAGHRRLRAAALASSSTAHNDFFEEIAKFRAARRIWAREMRETLRREEPALVAAALPHADGRRLADGAAAGEQHRRASRSRRWRRCWAARSRCTPTRMDEALALPTEKAAPLALRTQQIIAHESGVTNTVDPLGGSYFVEALTIETERQAIDYFTQIDELGGVLPASKAASSSARSPRRRYALPARGRDNERMIVGVNDYVMDGAISIPTLYIDPAKERVHLERLERVRRERDSEAASAGPRRAHRGRARDGEHDALHPRLRARLLHARRDHGRLPHSLSANTPRLWCTKALSLSD